MKTPTVEIKVMYDSTEAAEIKTVTGWVSRSGRFWGKDEHMARWEGSTHKLCECGNLIKKERSKCDFCSEKVRVEMYYKLPLAEWDGKTPVALWDDDKYFFDEGDIEDYLEESELEPEALRLVLCEPNYPRCIDEDYWEDSLPDDGEMPKDIKAKIEELNALLKSSKPISWSHSHVRTEYKSEATA